jgi:multidrug efflux system membrane fusion protein
VIPSSVVQRGPQGTYAYLIKPDKTVEMRPIKVAQTEGNLALVDEGLQPGEQVVVDGQYKLQPGAHVELTTPQQSNQARPVHVRQPGQKMARSGKP